MHSKSSASLNSVTAAIYVIKQCNLASVSQMTAMFYGRDGQTMESYIYRCYRIPWSDEDSGSLTPG